MRYQPVVLVLASVLLPGAVYAQDNTSPSAHQPSTLQFGRRNPFEHPLPPQQFTPPPNIAGQSAWIPLHHQRQETSLCVPTSASIVLDYLGTQASPREIKELSMGRQYAPGEPFNDFTLTAFPDLAAGLHRLGYSWQVKDYSGDPKGLRQGLAAIERSLDAGIPVLIDTTPVTVRPGFPVEGHTFVIAGYSASQQALYAVDPNRAAPGTRVVSFQELESIWNSQSVNSDRRAAVFPQRRRAR